MLLSGSGSRSETAVGYRFAGVVVDVQRARLLIDQREVTVGVLPLKLLRTVCEANGALVSRQMLFEQIWPRQAISDEALTKLIGRTRELLGPYGAALTTVRGQGLRLDLPVAGITAGSAAASASTSAAPASKPLISVPKISPTPAAQRRHMRGVPMLLAATIALLAVAVWRWPVADPVLSAGYALRASDLQASRSETAELVSAAFKAEGNGEIVHARTMMRSAHESDPSSPVPALMLAWWEANASPDSAHTWIAAARARLRPDSSGYLRLMVDYFDARSGDSGQVRGPINALLDLRPQAWRLQFARAHDQLANREFAGALSSLQQIPLNVADADQVADVLADRVSLGDTAAASQVTPAIESDVVVKACLSGRFAYSRGALGKAIAAFDRCREAAQVRRDYYHARTAGMYAALAAVEGGDVDAVQRVDGTARLCHEQNVQSCEMEMSGLRAFLEARTGRADMAAATLADAWQHNLWDWAKPPLILLALENGLAPPADPAEIARAIPRDAVFGGVADVLLGWQALAGGDMQRAQRQLQLAREHGIANTYHAEDAALLGARLGETPTACRVDPPYPNLLRLNACVLLRALQKQ
jgi:DNA-binding winged helix-turn-helix (wHTH) protein